MASSRVSGLLALEIGRSAGQAENRPRAAGPDPADEQGQPALGRTAYPRRTAQAWLRGCGVDGPNTWSNAEDRRRKAGEPFCATMRMPSSRSTCAWSPPSASSVSLPFLSSTMVEDGCYGSRSRGTRRQNGWRSRSWRHSRGARRRCPGSPDITKVALAESSCRTPDRDAAARLFGSRADFRRAAFATDPDLVFAVLQ